MYKFHSITRRKTDSEKIEYQYHFSLSCRDKIKFICPI